jgi:hypothetical protein
MTIELASVKVVSGVAAFMRDFDTFSYGLGTFYLRKAVYIPGCFGVSITQPLI